MNLDQSLFFALNGLAGTSQILDGVAIFFAEYSQYVWVVLLAGLFDLPLRRLPQHRLMVTLALVAALIARFAVKFLIVLFYARVRPYEALSGVHQLIPVFADSRWSFPSGHALFFFAIASVVFTFNKRWGSVAFLAATLMGISRIYAGVHYPSDILGGAILGSLIGFATVYWYRFEATR